MGKKAGKPHHFSTLLHHLFKVQGSKEMHADIVDLKSTMNQFNIFKMYTVFTQQQDTNSIQFSIDNEPGDTGTYPGT